MHWLDWSIRIMSTYDKGNWFAYQYSVSLSGRPQGEIAIERFVISDVQGDEVTVIRDINQGTPETIKGSLAKGSCVFDFSNLDKRGSDNMKTPLGSMYVTIYEKDDGDIGQRIFVGKDNIAFRVINTRKTDNGLLTETHELCWTNVSL